MTEKVFDFDEMNMLEVQAHWTKEDLLNQEGLFFLKDIVKILGVEPVIIKKEAKIIAQRNEDPWSVMGARKMWTHWIIRMRVFAPFYEKNLVPKFDQIPKGIDSNQLLELNGIFSLSQVCDHLPFSPSQLRYQAKKTENSRKVTGIWKDEESNLFLVEMKFFAPYIKGLWEKNFGNP